MKDAASERPEPAAPIQGAGGLGDERVLDRSASLCPTCGDRADALLLERDGKIFGRTLCPVHAGTERLLLSDSRLHHRLEEWNRLVFAPGSDLEDENEDKAPLLAVIDLTNHCNSRCPVCFADVTGGNVYFLDFETVRGMLQSLIDYRQVIWQNLSHAAARRVFDLLRDVAAYRQVIDSDNGNGAADDKKQMQRFVRKAEQSALSDLLKIFSFSQVDVELKRLPVQDGRWELDVFSPGALKAFGLNASSSALTGAAAGAGVDLMVGGLSLGTGMTIGAAIGAGMATVRRYKQELKAAWRGNKWLCVDDNTVALLYLRQRELLHRLTHRGHAAQEKVEIGGSGDNTMPKDWSKIVDELRQHPEWHQGTSGNAEYERIRSKVTEWLLHDE